MKRLSLLLLALICFCSGQTLANEREVDHEFGIPGGPNSRTGDLWILSIGINNYGELKYNNCESDAKRFSEFFNNRYHRKDTISEADKKKVHEFILLGEKATRDAIRNALIKIIDSSKPNDYFVFNFAGVTLQFKSRNNEIFFLTREITNVSDSTTIFKESLSLKSLGYLFTLIPANNQFFFTEAGPTPEFRKEFIGLVIEKSAITAMLSEKRRIVMIPKGMGYDFLSCNGQRFQQGPLNYYLTQLPKTIDVFNLFNKRDLADEVVFAVLTNEVQCRTIKSPYSEIFFERDYLEHLQQLMGKEQPLKRGGVESKSDNSIPIEKKPGRKIALIVATNTFDAKEQWGYLPNPLNDANAIGDTLKNQYGYRVEYLFNKKKEDITKRLLSLRNELKEDDQLIIYFAGHGDTSSVLDDGYIVCKDSKLTSEDEIRGSYLPFNDLARMINNFSPKQILVLLDVCFAGNFSERVTKRILPDGNPPNQRESVLSQKLRLKTRKFISAGVIEVDDNHKDVPNHSPFATFVLEGLRTKGGALDLFTATYLFGLIQGRLPTNPLFNDFGDVNRGSDFILIPNKEANSIN